MDVTYQKDVCFFVGGTGSKAGVSIAGGCTKEWLAGILDTKSGHWYDPSTIPLDRFNRLPVSQGPV
jgi:hypothetical protein